MPNLSTNYNVLQCKADLNGILHGTTTNQVTGINNIFNRSAREVLMDIDPQETTRIAQTPQIFAQVFDYPIENLPDLKGNKIIDIRPQVNRSLRDVFGQKYKQQFDVNKRFAAAPMFTMDFNAAQKSLRIDATDLIYPTVINNADAITDNGTWAVGGSATNLSADSVNFASGFSSLKFDLPAGGSTGYLENSTMNPVDLTTFLNQAYQFLYSYLPTGSSFSNIELRFGSDASNYWSINYTTNWQASSFINGWNLAGNPWTSATKVLNPDVSKIKYCRVTWSYDGTAQTGVHLNQISSNLGQIFEILYYSKYLFRDAATGTFQETVTADDNLINLDTETFPVFFARLALNTVQQVSNKGYDIDIQYWQNEYVKQLARYQALYKSEVSKVSQTYYKTPKPSYQRWFGTRWP